MIKLPKKLTVICDQVVDHVHKDTPLPEDMEELVNWYETDGWDDLIMGQDYAPGILDLENFSQLKFSDEEMLAYEEYKPPLTNRVRILYAREQIANAFEEMGVYGVPNVHFVEIQNKAGMSAVLVWMVEPVHGGAEALYNGAFLDHEHFYQRLRDCGLVFRGEQNNLKDEAILKLWINAN
jgi:hypothetical protein